MNIIETNLNFGGLSYNNNPNKIVLHHLEANGWTVEDVHRCHREEKGWSGIGYHFYVRKDGSIYKGRDIEADGAHCPGANRSSIGICAEGMYMNDTMPEAQKQAIIQLGNYLKANYSIQGVYGHRDLYSTDCPGDNYPLQELINGIMYGTSSADVVTSSNASANPILVEQIKALQYNFNKVMGTSLKVDGVPGVNTVAVVNSYTITKGGGPNNIIRWIQQKLQLWGYKVRNITGIYDEETFQAVTELQKNWGRATDGIIGSCTWDIFLNN